MCKYCKIGDDGLGKHWDLINIGYGEKLKTTLCMYVSDTTKELELTKDASVDDGWYELEATQLTIAYCPFCGRKL